MAHCRPPDSVLAKNGNRTALRPQLPTPCPAFALPAELAAKRQFMDFAMNRRFIERFVRLRRNIDQLQSRAELNRL